MVLRDRDANSDGTLEERLWVVQDANHNVTALLDNSGNVVERFASDPFGVVTVLTPAWGVRGTSLYGWNYLHQGGRFDSTSGLYEFRHRWYSPTLMRWLTRDPIGFRAGDVNLYRFEDNNSVNRTDPSGLIRVYALARVWDYDRFNDDDLEVVLDASINIRCEGKSLVDDGGTTETGN
jgi:RHS repeat-associated protein